MNEAQPIYFLCTVRVVINVRGDVDCTVVGQ